MNKTKVAIIGANGYGGGELIKLLLGHPLVELVAISSRQYEGKPMSAAWANIPLDMLFESAETATEKADFVFFATHNGVAMHSVPALLAKGKKVVDLSADYRLTPETFTQWYAMDHASPELCSTAVYGLVEHRRETIQHAQLVANPGCYVTAAALALHPFAREGLIQGNVIVNGASGISGAGRGKAETAYSEVAEDFTAYGVGGVHRHTPEMEMNLAFSGHAAKILFTPHLLPMNRGILNTMYFSPSREVSAKELLELEKDTYQHEIFVKVIEGVPHTKATSGSNRVDITVRKDERTGQVLVFAALDNLLKGAAGQAVQNMNVMQGFEESLGLPRFGMIP